MVRRFAPARWALLTLAALAATLVAGCGGSGSSAGSSGGGAANAYGKTAQAELARLYKGTYTPPPATSPKPAAGKSVYLIGTDMAFSATSNAINGAAAAAKALGWSTTVVNGKSDPSQMLAGVRQAITAHANAIFLYAIDCPTVQAGLESARQAGIKVVAAESYDCSELQPGAPSLFDYVTQYSEGKLVDWGRAWGASQATVIAAKTGGRAKVINLVEPDFRATVIQDQGFRAQLATCKSCQIVDTLRFVATDVGPKLQQQIQQALLQHPEANATLVPYDAVATTALVGALRAAGRQGKLVVAGGEGTPEGVNLLRQGIVSSETGIPTAWEGWAAMDNLNRLFDGAPTAPTGLGIQVIDKDHNLPASGGFTSPVDFASAYRKAWGASG